MHLPVENVTCSMQCTCVQVTGFSEGELNFFPIVVIVLSIFSISSIVLLSWDGANTN